MEHQHPPDSPAAAPLPAFSVKHHHAYFSPAEIEYFTEKQRGRLSQSQEDKARHQACGFIEAVGAKIGFPRKTIATAQQLYHRFHLFYPRKDFGYHDVALAALYVSAKMHDTLKKPRELVMIAYGIRFPELIAKSQASSSRGGFSMSALTGEVDMDPATVEHDRQHLLAVERLILETVCFNFTSRMPFAYVIKLGKEIKATKKLTKFAWRLTVDSNRTLAPLQYPPHTIALSCLFLAALLTIFDPTLIGTWDGVVTLPAHRTPAPFGASEEVTVEHASAQRVVRMFGERGVWESVWRCQVEDLEAVAHMILDLLIQASQQPSTSLNTSPQTPSSPSPHPSPHPQPHVHASHLNNPNHPHHPTTTSNHQPNAATAPPLAPHLAYDALIRLKIQMREREHAPRVRVPIMSPEEVLEEARTAAASSHSQMSGGGEGGAGDGREGGEGRRDGGTVRFLFGTSSAQS